MSAVRCALGSPVRTRRLLAVRADAVRYIWFVLASLVFGALVQPASADVLDAVPVDQRAQLAVAACAYPPAEAPSIDPDSNTFNPGSAANYLNTAEDGLYSVSIQRGDFEIYYTLIRFADEKEAEAGMAAWKSSGEVAIPVDWGGSFPVFRRGQGILGVSMMGAGSVARGQSGRWHFEVSVAPKGLGPGVAVSDAEIAAVAEAMKLLAFNATKYRIFPRDLIVEYQAGGEMKRLLPGDPLQVPLSADAEAEARFRLQVLDGGKPVEKVRYTLEITGALAGVASYLDGGSKVKRTLVETTSEDGAPVEIAFVFPPATSAEMSRLLDRDDLSISMSVKAETAPTVLP